MSIQLLERPVVLTVPATEPDDQHAPVPGQPDHRTAVRETAEPGTLQAAVPYRIGTPDSAGRYPVIIGQDQVIGRARRWSRDWWVETSAGETNFGRPDKGVPGVEMAAARLAEKYAAGEITAIPLDQIRAEVLQPLTGPVPLLHPRMLINDRNVKSALAAFAGLANLRWRAVLTGFPGSDNHWVLLCELCGWVGPKFWSHLRGRNGGLPSLHRHDGGCVGPDRVRQLIPAYQQ
ncbi:hypothetical protein [Streptomyces sp. CBMA123]|uniref:hypothetical protein n=1 Tax=Streptomyces sp. CBMA123 TaxID=1896313 RepID=UPI001662185B|nr:hypothetical protein [Streptomyces sp. CBMA123]MBD0688530.1 hypothetical protein [Streptomyces sp. CBMA123]